MQNYSPRWLQKRVNHTHEKMLKFRAEINVFTVWCKTWDTSFLDMMYDFLLLLETKLRDSIQETCGL